MLVMPENLDLLRRAACGDAGALLEEWLDEVVRRTWQLHGRPAIVAQLRERCASIIVALASTLRCAPGAGLGSPEWREPLHLLSFTAGWMAGVGISVSGALALAHGLREAVGAGPPGFFDAIETALTEAHAAAMTQQAHARHRNVIERSQVVCLVTDRLPCLFLVGDPDRQALDDAAGRLMMLAVMRQAQAMIVDGSGLVAPEETLPAALEILAEHRRDPPPRLLLSTVLPGVAARLEAVEHPSGMRTFERLEDAVQAAR